MSCPTRPRIPEFGEKDENPAEKTSRFLVVEIVEHGETSISIIFPFPSLLT